MENLFVSWIITLGAALIAMILNLGDLQITCLFVVSAVNWAGYQVAREVRGAA